jgi:Phage portal protein, SPP1 Gp6-like
LAYDFSNRISSQDIHNALLKSLGARLSPTQLKQLNLIKTNWNFYKGYHWEEVPVGDGDKPQVTENYCRPFVNKMVSFELGKGFNVKMKPEIEQIGVVKESKGDGENKSEKVSYNDDYNNNPHRFVNAVWKSNSKGKFCQELGQSKSITGDGWVQVAYEPKTLPNGKENPNFHDPFEEFDKGKIRLLVAPSSCCFAEYEEGFDKDRLKKFNIMYPIEKPVDKFFGSTKLEKVLYKQEWTNDRVRVFEGEEKILDIPNKYGTIPFVQIKNLALVGENYGVSDLEDVIPLNMEINLKKSDVSEIIDYHSAPVTVVFGARIGQLERGANKVWGGLPKDARMENLKLEGDLVAANNYIAETKSSMMEIANVPKGALGGDLAISNTSAIALQMALMPLTERIEMKQTLTKEGLEQVNKLIILIGLKEGLIEKPEGVTMRNFVENEVTFDSAIPKDVIAQLQQLEIEMKLGMADREEGMERMNKDNIQHRMNKIDEDRKKNPMLYGIVPPEQQTGFGMNKDGKPKQVNAGYTNSPNPKLPIQK